MRAPIRVETVQCTLILMSEWRSKLPGHLRP